MWLIRMIWMVLLTILTSFYFFPFEFVFLPGINTKMVMAGFGLVLLAFQLPRQSYSAINRDFFVISLFAGIVSLIGLLAVVWNKTNDYVYATYIVSMWVWAAAAYVVIYFMKILHGGISVRLICNYLIMVCVAQCILAYLMSLYVPLKEFVDSFLGGTGFMGKSETRLYGVGASLDVAGTRFGAILIMIVYLLIKVAGTAKRHHVGLYLVAFVIVLVLGNMIARTTIIGGGLSLAYFIYVSKFYKFRGGKPDMSYIYCWIGVLLIVLLPVMIYFYQVDMGFQQNIRFAFEGFFSLVEKGRWEVNSNEILKDMYVFPENLKTWIIGDGYFGNPYLTDLYYIGPNWNWAYNDTDVGYSRFIFYFGLLGLVAFTAFFCKVGYVCMQRFLTYRIMFLSFVFLNFAIWFKVSTDIFLVFALFLMVSKEEDEKFERQHLIDYKSNK